MSPVQTDHMQSLATALQHLQGARVPSQGAAAREEDDNVAESGKLRGGCLADVFTFSLTEVHGDKLSLLSQDDQLLSRPYRHSVKQECVT
ncbi:TPA: hypothetical protein ACH3X3_003918 [Trebouxia sp. C0006]